MDIFDIWNQEKKDINRYDSRQFYINEREIWFTKMGKNIGNEEDGKDEFLRPVLVLKKVGNLFFTVALTTKGKESRYYHKIKDLELTEKNKHYIDRSFCVLSQVRVMDKRRFTQHIGLISQEEMKNIKQKLKTLLF